jgi:hypothetical protein
VNSGVQFGNATVACSFLPPRKCVASVLLHSSCTTLTCQASSTAQGCDLFKSLVLWEVGTTGSSRLERDTQSTSNLNNRIYNLALQAHAPCSHNNLHSALRIPHVRAFQLSCCMHNIATQDTCRHVDLTVGEKESWGCCRGRRSCDRWRVKTNKSTRYTFLSIIKTIDQIALLFNSRLLRRLHIPQTFCSTPLVRKHPYNRCPWFVSGWPYGLPYEREEVCVSWLCEGRE